MDTKKLVAELRQTAADFVEALLAFRDDHINLVPFEGSWTGGQTAEHIIKAESDLPQLLLGQTAPTSRPADQYIQPLTAIFLDFTKKYQAADNLMPSDGPHDKAALVAAFQAKREEIINIAENEDLSLSCTDFAFPQLAELTRWEWLNFVNFHCIRHTRQMWDILEKLDKK